jgi:hypothetical protein
LRRAWNRAEDVLAGGEHRERRIERLELRRVLEILSADEEEHQNGPIHQGDA